MRTFVQFIVANGGGDEVPPELRPFAEAFRACSRKEQNNIFAVSQILVNYPALPAASPPLEDGACDCPRRPHERSSDVTFGWLTAALAKRRAVKYHQRSCKQLPGFKPGGSRFEPGECLRNSDMRLNQTISYSY